MAAAAPYDDMVVGKHVSGAAYYSPLTMVAAGDTGHLGGANPHGRRQRRRAAAAPHPLSARDQGAAAPQP